MTDIKTIPLDYPRTVCSNIKCIKLSTARDKQTVEYATVCHRRCKLVGVIADTYGHPLLMKCVALRESSGTQCRSCQHPYNDHLHIYYESVQIFVEVENQSIKDAYDKGLSAAQTKQNMISDRKAQIAELEEEHKEIERASVQFACFLKCNAITPYNDGMEQYLNYLIREEKDKVAENGNPQVLERLECSLRSYTEERKILEDEMKKGETNVNVLNPTDIEKLVNKLKNLKACGAFLKEALECVEKTRAAVFEEAQPQKCIRTKNKSILSWAAKKFRPKIDKLIASDLTYGVKDLRI